MEAGADPLARRHPSLSLPDCQSASGLLSGPVRPQVLWGLRNAGPPNHPGQGVELFLCDTAGPEAPSWRVLLRVGAAQQEGGQAPWGDLPPHAPPPPAPSRFCEADPSRPPAHIAGLARADRRA